MENINNFSDDELVRDWSLSEGELALIQSFTSEYRLYVGLQLCSMRLRGSFLEEVHDLPPRIFNFVGKQLHLPPTMTVIRPGRRNTRAKQHEDILKHLGFVRFGELHHVILSRKIYTLIQSGIMGDEAVEQVANYMIGKRIVLPGKVVLQRWVAKESTSFLNECFDRVYRQMSSDLKNNIDKMLITPVGEKASFFAQLKEHAPSAKIYAMKRFLQNYFSLTEMGVEELEKLDLDTHIASLFFQQSRSLNAWDIRRFEACKRYAVMAYFLFEVRSELLDNLVKMHDQYMIGEVRESRNLYEKKLREMRKAQRIAVETMLHVAPLLLDLKDDQQLSGQELWAQVGREEYKKAIDELTVFKTFTDYGIGRILLTKYSSMRKYFSLFVQLPFSVEKGSEYLLEAIKIIRSLDDGSLKNIPENASTEFVPKYLRVMLGSKAKGIKRNAWEMGLAIAMKNALRSGDLFLPQSKQHVSFWNLILNKKQWEKKSVNAPAELNKPAPSDLRSKLTENFNWCVQEAKKQFPNDDFAQIIEGKLKLKRDDKLPKDPVAERLQKVINSSMPAIRIEKLLMEVDKATGFTRHFKHVQNKSAKSKHFYKALLAALIAQGTNLGATAMSESVEGISVDMLRNVFSNYIREDTLSAANACIVNAHHLLPLSSVHGGGSFSSSDGQRFKITADSLLASHYPRYYGYYEKALSVYTHMSDQLSVYSTLAISCGVREALYVLDGILRNNTILLPRAHTTDTHGYTEILFALCYLLDIDFMPRIRDLKDQQLYRLNKHTDYGVFSPLLNLSVDLDLIEEQYPDMLHIALSLKERTAPAHVIIRRLSSSYPVDRLAKALTHLGRIKKTEHILSYITNPPKRRTIGIQLNKGEYRQNLPRHFFIGNQGFLTTGDPIEIANKVSALSLLSNAALYWNTVEISKVLTRLQNERHCFEKDMLARISLLPYHHILPNGTYFNDAEFSKI